MRPSLANGVQASLVDEERSGIFPLSATAEPVAQMAITAPAKNPVHVTVPVSALHPDFVARSEIICSPQRRTVLVALPFRVKLSIDSCSLRTIAPTSNRVERRSVASQPRRPGAS